MVLDLAHMVVVGGVSILNLLFLGQAMGVLGKAFTERQEIHEGSKAGLSSLPRTAPR